MYGVGLFAAIESAIWVTAPTPEMGVWEKAEAVEPSLADLLVADQDLAEQNDIFVLNHNGVSLRGLLEDSHQTVPAGELLDTNALIDAFLTIVQGESDIAAVDDLLARQISFIVQASGEQVELVGSNVFFADRLVALDNVHSDTANDLARHDGDDLLVIAALDSKDAESTLAIVFQRRLALDVFLEVATRQAVVLDRVDALGGVVGNFGRARQLWSLDDSAVIVGVNIGGTGQAGKQQD
jgi:hypothetical protein